VPNGIGVLGTICSGYPIKSGRARSYINCRCEFIRTIRINSNLHWAVHSKMGNYQDILLSTVTNGYECKKMKPDKGWDYNPGAGLTEGVRRAVDSRQNKGNGVLLMTMIDLLSQETPPVSNGDYHRAASGGKHAGFFNKYNMLADQELKKIYCVI